MDCTQKFDTVCDKVFHDDLDKWDALVPSQEIMMLNGRLHFPDALADGYEFGLAPTPWATGQICQRLGMPSPYFRKCPSFLQDAQFNHWVQEQNAAGLDVSAQQSKKTGNGPQKWLVRCRHDALRGVLSERYSRLDNSTLLECLHPIQERGFEVGYFGLTDESMHLRLIDPRLGRDVLPDDRLMVGVHLANSEVGMRAVTVDALVFRLVCTNGLIRKVHGKSTLYQRHVSYSHGNFKAALADAVAEALTTAAGFTEQLAWAVKQAVPDIEGTLKSLSSEWGLTQTTQEFVKLALLGEPAGQQETLYGLINAVTNAAQRLPLDDRYTLEVLAGDLLERRYTTPIAPRPFVRARRLASTDEHRPGNNGASLAAAPLGASA